MCSPEDTSVVAHTRGRTVLCPAVPADPSASIPAQSHHKSRVWTGEMINLAELVLYFLFIYFNYFNTNVYNVSECFNLSVIKSN